MQNCRIVDKAVGISEVEEAIRVICMVEESDGIISEASRLDAELPNWLS
jgi:glycerol-3-phosphate responsive antiterminator